MTGCAVTSGSRATHATDIWAMPPLAVLSTTTRSYLNMSMQGRGIAAGGPAALENALRLLPAAASNLRRTVLAYLVPVRMPQGKLTRMATLERSGLQYYLLIGSAIRQGDPGLLHDALAAEQQRFMHVRPPRPDLARTKLSQRHTPGAQHAGALVGAPGAVAVLLETDTARHAGGHVCAAAAADERMMLRRILECQLKEGGSGPAVSLRTMQAVLERCIQHYTIEEAHPHTSPTSQPLLLPTVHAYHALHGHPTIVLAVVKRQAARHRRLLTDRLALLSAPCRSL